MAVFRVERNTGYTVMSNHHLRNKELSLKAKGLLSQMLSFHILLVYAARRIDALCNLIDVDTDFLYLHCHGFNVAMVYLDNVAVNGNLPKICRHVPGGDELHFLLNQRPFFLCYIEFDLYFSFASVHAIAPFHSEGLGHFPTSSFQPTRRSAGGRKYGKGYSFPMLAMKVLSLVIYYNRKSLFAKRE